MAWHGEKKARRQKTRVWMLLWAEGRMRAQGRAVLGGTEEQGKRTKEADMYHCFFNDHESPIKTVEMKMFHRCPGLSTEHGPGFSLSLRPLRSEHKWLLGVAFLWSSPVSFHRWVTQRQ